jgi:hypothetical protein
MNHNLFKQPSAAVHSLLLVILAIGYALPGAAQKVKTGHDKSTDFSKYRTYTWAKPHLPAERPLLYDYVVKTIDDQLNAKGLQRIDTNGDLTLIPAGGMEYGSNLPSGTPVLSVYGGPPPAVNSTMWTGANPSLGSGGPMVAEGSLTLEMVDRSSNKVVWNGTVTEKFDPTQKEKSLTLAGKAVVKLLKGFPPKNR